MNIQNRLAEEKRQDLSKALPLSQPYVLLVDPSNICNLRCKWCPSGYDDLILNSKRNQKIMDIKMFERVLNQAEEFEGNFKVLRLYKEGEPLVNQNFSEMVWRAKRTGKFDRIDTTTNGILLNPELNRKIVSSGIDQINISVNGVSEEQIYRNTGRKIDFSKYVANIKDLCRNSEECIVYVKCIEDILTETEKKKFFELFGELADRVYLERLSPAWPNFDVTQSGYDIPRVGNYGQKIEDRIACPYLFYIMVVNSDGTVSTCVGDWEHNQIVGDICDNTLKEIWLGKKMKEYQRKHLQNKRREMRGCRNCQVINYGCYDNIDKERLRIQNDLMQ